MNHREMLEPEAFVVYELGTKEILYSGTDRKVADEVFCGMLKGCMMSIAKSDRSGNAYASFRTHDMN